MNGERVLVEQFTVRVDEQLTSMLDEYVQRRSREARVALSRSQAVRELLDSCVVEGRLVECPSARAYPICDCQKTDT